MISQRIKQIVLITAILFIACGAALFFPSLGRTTEKRPSIQSTEELAKILEGKAAYESQGGIYVAKVGSREAQLFVRSGSYPRWSPDGRFLAFIRGKQIMRMDIDSRQEEVLASAAAPRAVAYHPNGKAVLFIDEKEVRSVDVETKEIKSIVRGSSFREIDLSSDGDFLAASIKSLGMSIRIYDLVKSKEQQLSSGCSASFSPDAKMVTNNAADHRSLLLRSVNDGKIVSELLAPANEKLDNQFWSNHQDWIASRSEKENAAFIFVQRVSTAEIFQISYGGREDRPDFYVRSIL